MPTQRVATNVLADDKKVQAKVAKKLAKQQVGVFSTKMYPSKTNHINIMCVYVFVMIETHYLFTGSTKSRMLKAGSAVCPSSSVHS